MKVLVTGAAGNLGRFFVDEISRDHEVLATDLSRENPFLNDPKVSYEKADIRLKKDCDRLIGADLGKMRIDALVHCGAVSAPKNDPTLTFEVNGAGTFYLLNACSEMGLGNIILATSGWAQGMPSSGFLPRRLPIDENTIGSFTDMYHITKRFNEHNGNMLVDAGSLKKVISMRLGGLWDIEKDGLGALSTDPFWTRLDFRDAAKALRLAMESDFLGFDYYLVGSKYRYDEKGELESYSQLCEKLEKAELGDLIVDLPCQEKGQQTYDLKKIFNALAFSPKF